MTVTELQDDCTLSVVLVYMCHCSTCLLLKAGRLSDSHLLLVLSWFAGGARGLVDVLYRSTAVTELCSRSSCSANNHQRCVSCISSCVITDKVRGVLLMIKAAAC